MSRTMTPEQIDAAVLAALRAITEGSERRIGNKTVRLAGPKGDKCVYARIGVEMHKAGHLAGRTFRDLPSCYRELQQSLRRLTNRDLLFINKGGDMEDRSYWVAMN